MLIDRNQDTIVRYTVDETHQIVIPLYYPDVDVEEATELVRQHLFEYCEAHPEQYDHFNSPPPW